MLGNVWKIVFGKNKGCFFCGEQVAVGETYCFECRNAVGDWQRSAFCRHCGRHLKEYGCSCKGKATFKRTIAALPYRGVFRKAVKEFKFGKSTWRLNILIQLLLARWDNAIAIDLVTFVPMHSTSEAIRGFHPTQILACKLAEKLKLPYSDDLVLKNKNNKAQSLVSTGQRKKNVQGVFVLKPSINVVNKKVLLIDDVFTTGATVEEISTLLMTAGADSIYILCLAMS